MDVNNVKFNNKDGCVYIYGDFKLSNVNESMDLILSSTFEFNSNKIIISAKNLDEKFFDLKTKFAGELLQKLINYNCTVVIFGEFESRGSKALNDFIFECNRKENTGSRIFFLATLEEGLEKLNSKY